jgi:hypothetical protein
VSILLTRLASGSRLCHRAFLLRTSLVADRRRHDGQAAAGQFLDIAEVFPLVGRTECNRDAARASSCRAADSMHVALRNVRQLVVDDMRDLVDVDAARGDIGRDQNARESLAEAVERGLTLTLALVAMDREHTNAAMLECLANAIRATLRAREHDHTPHLRILEQSVEHLTLGARVHEHHALIDAIHGLACSSNLDAYRILENLGGKARDVLGHRR